MLSMQLLPLRTWREPFKVLNHSQGIQDRTQGGRVVGNNVYIYGSQNNKRVGPKHQTNKDLEIKKQARRRAGRVNKFSWVWQKCPAATGITTIHHNTKHKIPLNHRRTSNLWVTGGGSHGRLTGSGSNQFGGRVSALGFSTCFSSPSWWSDRAHYSAGRPVLSVFFSVRWFNLQ